MDVVFLIFESIVLICWLIFWIFIRFGFLILMFMGVLILVVNILICVLIGIIYVFVNSGKLIIVLNFLIRFWVVMFLCYWFWGFNCINVFIIVNGVGLVVVLVCLILLNIVLILGMVLISLLVCCNNLCVLFIEILV